MECRYFLPGVVTTVSVDSFCGVEIFVECGHFCGVWTFFVECGYSLPGVVTTVSVDSFCGVEIFSQGVDIFSQGVDSTVLFPPSSDQK